jgi:DNA-binding transcriptional LysR family regulator
VLDLKRLVALKEVARLQSFSAAASELSLTQSAVSQQVAALEKQLGVALLDRGPPIVLTTPGRVLVARTTDALAHLSAAEAEIGAFRGLKTGRLRIAAFASALRSFMPEALRRFHASYPDVQVSLRQVEPRTALEALRRGEIDVAVTNRYTVGPEESSVLALRRQHLFDEDVLVALPADHRHAGAEPVWLRDLASDLWIEAVNAGIPLELLAQFATTTGFRSNATFEGDDFATVLQLVASGAGVACVPALAARELPGGVVLVHIAPDGLTRELHAVTLDTGIPTPATTAIVEVLTQLGREWAPMPRPRRASAWTRMTSPTARRPDLLAPRAAGRHRGVHER